MTSLNPPLKFFPVKGLLLAKQKGTFTEFKDDKERDYYRKFFKYVKRHVLANSRAMIPFLKGEKQVYFKYFVRFYGAFRTPEFQFQHYVSNSAKTSLGDLILTVFDLYLFCRDNGISIPTNKDMPLKELARHVRESSVNYKPIPDEVKRSLEHYFVKLPPGFQDAPPLNADKNSIDNPATKAKNKDLSKPTFTFTQVKKGPPITPLLREWAKLRGPMPSDRELTEFSLSKVVNNNMSVGFIKTGGLARVQKQNIYDPSLPDTGLHVIEMIENGPASHALHVHSVPNIEEAIKLLIDKGYCR